MSAAEPPDPVELERELPVSAVEAEALAEALNPLQDLSAAGASFGSAVSNLDAPGPKLLGTVLQNASTHVELMSISLETIAEAVNFYVQSQTQGAGDLFPPPHVALQQVQDDFEPLRQSIENGGPPP